MGGYKIDETLTISANIWRDVTSQEEIKKQTMVRNKRHLQHTERKEGVTTCPLMNDIQEKHGLNKKVDDLLARKFVMEYELLEGMTA